MVRRKLREESPDHLSCHCDLPNIVEHNELRALDCKCNGREYSSMELHGHITKNAQVPCPEES